MEGEDEGMKTETIKIKDLRPYEKNARKHEAADVAAIAKSIEAFGFRDPVGVWGPNNIIVEGHGRVMAAKQLGMTEVQQDRGAVLLGCGPAAAGAPRSAVL